MTHHRLSRYLSTVPLGRRSSGFTLIELIISIVLIGMLATVGSSMLVDTFSTTRMVNADTASAGQARYALERLAREIREIKHVSGSATCSDGSTNSYCITTRNTNPAKMVFTKTVQNADGTGTDVTVTIDTAADTTPGTSGLLNLTLLYSSTDPQTPPPTLCSHVSSFTLSYIPEPSNATLTNSNIRFVVITLTVTDPTSGQSIAQRTRVALRNA